MTKANECTCPSGDGSLRHPCPAHPALVEQAGGDERDLQGAQGERDGWGPFPIVQVPWNVFDRAVMWVEDRRRYGDDGTIVDDWKALKTIQRAALAQPSPKCATCNGTGQIVVSGPHYCGELQPPEYETEPCDMCSQPSPAQADEKPGDSILCYGCFAKGVGPDHFDEAGKCLAAQAEQAEAERPPQPERYTADVFHPERPYYMAQTSVVRASDFDEFATQYERIVGALRFERQQMDRAFTACINERDAALDRVAEMEQSQGAEVFLTLTCEITQLKSKLAELEKQEPVAWMDPRSPEMHATISNEVKQHNMRIGNAPASAVNGYSIPLYAVPVAQAQHSVPDVCDGKEQDAFEEWARKEGLDTSCHPMHWLFLDAKTNSARQGWKAALRYVRAHIAAPAKAQHSVPEEVRTLLSRAQCEIEHLAECLENVCEDEEDFDVREDVADGRVVAADIAHMLAAAPGKEGL
ncbi:hypothetical protein ACIPJD_07850 [Pseudomonas aeruginosa]